MPDKKSSRPAAPEICPVCAEEVPPNAKACPECGADHNSGWREGAETNDALGLPEDEFDYDEFVRQEFGSGPKPAAIEAGWWIAAILLLLAFGAAWLLGAFR